MQSPLSKPMAEMDKEDGWDRLVKPESVGRQAAARRPPDYNDLPPAEQWRIDKELGILDWDGE